MKKSKEENIAGKIGFIKEKEYQKTKHEIKKDNDYFSYKELQMLYKYMRNNCENEK